MEADIRKFADSINSYTKEQLFDLCLQLKRDNSTLEIYRKETRRSDTAIAREYQELSKSFKDLKSKYDDLLKSYERITAQNHLLVKQRFGSHNEKMDVLYASSGQDIQDPLSEDADPEAEDAVSHDTNKIIPFGEKSSKVSGKKSGKLLSDNQKARTEARKVIKNALGNGREKKTRTKMDLSGLPHVNTFNLNIGELDKLYGYANWEIVNWHEKKLLHKPLASYYVECIYTPVIKRRDDGSLISMPAPCALLRRSQVTPEVLANIMYEKYFKSVPLYRQSADLANIGLMIPRQDMSNWIVHFANLYFKVPYKYMKMLQCKRKYGHSDESTLQVLHEENRDARTKSYVWVHTTGELDDGPCIVIFAYEPTRGTDHLRTYYIDFSGALTTDAYISYDVLGKESHGRIIICGCLMHARRRFAEAMEIIDIRTLSKKEIDVLPEYRALTLLGKIYHAEAELKSLDAKERLKRRQSDVKPLVDDFYTLIESFDLDDPLLSEKFKDAITYSINQKESLCRFLEDGMIPCDNGFAENCLRLYAQGRRNWLFSNTPEGAHASTIIYSMVETARHNAANPLIYLNYLLEKVPDYLEFSPYDPRIEELMPWSDRYRQYEKEKLKASLEQLNIVSQEKPYYRPYCQKADDQAKALPNAS